MSLKCVYTAALMAQYIRHNSCIVRLVYLFVAFVAVSVSHCIAQESEGTPLYEDAFEAGHANHVVREDCEVSSRHIATDRGRQRQTPA